MAGGLVPYETDNNINFHMFVESVLTFDYFYPAPAQMAELDASIYSWNTKTCIRLRPKQAGDRNWVRFQEGTG